MVGALEGITGTLISHHWIHPPMGAIIDGKRAAESVLAEVRGRVVALRRRGVTPGLRAVLLGDDPASVSYVRAKARACERVGVAAGTMRLPADTSVSDLLDRVRALNDDERVHGVLVQFPLPGHIPEEKVISAIRPEKDVDGLHPENLGLLARGTPRVVPCTPLGIQRLLTSSGNPPDGKHVVIVGRSHLVGRPLSILLSLKVPGANATVTLCHSQSVDLASHTLRADILVAAAGSPGTITSAMVPEGCVVIDVGVNRVPDPTRKSGYRLVGDADFSGLLPKVKAITPVPGGVGPMTVAMLVSNTVRACLRQHAPA